MMGTKDRPTVVVAYTKSEAHPTQQVLASRGVDARVMAAVPATLDGYTAAEWVIVGDIPGDALAVIEHNARKSRSKVTRVSPSWAALEAEDCDCGGIVKLDLIDGARTCHRCGLVT